MLVHHADPASYGVGGIADGDWLAIDTYLAAVRRDESVEDVHEGRLAGAVLAQERVDLASAHVEIDRVVRERPCREPFRDPAHFEDWRLVAHALLTRRAGRPWGPCPIGGPTPEASPLDLDSLAISVLGDGLQLPGCHVRRRLLDLVFEARRDGIEVADLRCADAGVGGVVREVPCLLAFVLEALDPVPDRDLEVLFGARDDAG